MTQTSASDIPQDQDMDSTDTTPLTPSKSRVNFELSGADTNDFEEPPQNPSFLSKLFFVWIIKLIARGARKQLEQTDLYTLPYKERPAPISHQFDESLAPYLSELPSEKRVLFKVFKKLHWKRYFLAVILYGCSQLIQVFNTFFLNGLIQWVQYKNEAYFRGWIYAAGLCILPFISTFFFNHAVIIAFRVAMKVRVALTMAVYEKIMRLSSIGQDGSSMGEVVDLVNNDANRIINSFHEVIFGLIAPIQIIVITVLLYTYIGPYAFVSIGAIIVLLAPNGLIAKNMHSSRKNMLHHTDDRIKAISELVTGVRAIKCYVWESFFRARIQEHRNAELREIKRFAYLKALLYFLMALLPSLVALATFVAYVLAGNPFTANKVFVTLSLLNLIRFPLYYIPVAIINISGSMVAFGRIQRFLALPEVQQVKSGERKQAIYAQAANFNWTPEKTASTLSNVNFELERGKFTIVIGPVGSGKSTLLQGLMGEVHLESGDLEINGRVGYVPQQAWILNATLKDNILMGSPYDEKRFKATTAACALDSDIEMLPGGVMTQIGEKGINISGGQQQRVSLARAVYQSKDIYLLDDVLSAVDYKVAWHIFNNCITGVLKDKTVVFVTNNLQFLSYADKVVVLKPGEIVMQVNKGEADSEQIIQQLNNMGIKIGAKTDEEDVETVQTTEVPIEPEEDYRTPNPVPITFEPLVMASPEGARRRSSIKAIPEFRRSSSTLTPSNLKKVSTPIQPKAPTDHAAHNLVKEEERMKGNIPWSVYMAYINSGGAILFFFLIIMFAIGLGAHSGSDYWLSVWTGRKLGLTTALYVIVYACFSGGELVFQAIASFSMVGFGLKASRVMHDRMLASITYANVQFYDANPMGRIINRFSRDMDMIDTGLTERMYQYFASFVYIASTVVILGVTSYWIVVAVVPIGVMYYFLQKLYRRSSIELKRLEAITKSPLLAQVVETLSGVPSIRAFGLQPSFVGTFRQKVDLLNRAFYCLMLTTQWLGLALDLLGVLVMVATVLVIVIERDTISPSIVGLAIVYATSLRFGLQFSVTAATQTEIGMNGTERILEYTRLPQEMPPPPNPVVLAPDWPSKGQVVFNDMTIRYRPELDPVITNFSCTIQPGDKIGIVGRTGAGKSTLTQALFRLVPLSGGSIVIDGVDIYSIGIPDVRSRLAIIPQLPMLFQGTLRLNLDPYDKHTDQEIWDALDVVQLKDVISALPLKLDSLVDPGGDNFSVGQKQLLCMARALLQKARVLVLDEAMANVDFKTEAIINEAIAKHLVDVTVIQIAHRIGSILDSTKVMVLDKGKLMEFDSPKALMDKPNSIFHAMVVTAGEAE